MLKNGFLCLLCFRQLSSIMLFDAFIEKLPTQLRQFPLCKSFTLRKIAVNSFGVLFPLVCCEFLNPMHLTEFWRLQQFSCNIFFFFFFFFSNWLWINLLDYSSETFHANECIQNSSRGITFDKCYIVLASYFTSKLVTLNMSHTKENVPVNACILQIRICLHNCTVFTVHLKKQWILGYHDAWQRLIRLHICTFFTVHLRHIGFLAVMMPWQRLIGLHICTFFTFHCPPEEIMNSWLSWCLTKTDQTSHLYSLHFPHIETMDSLLSWCLAKTDETSHLYRLHWPSEEALDS